MSRTPFMAANWKMYKTIADAEEYVNPDKVPARVVLGAAVDALSAMTREAAARPDPRRTFGARFRKLRERS